MKKSSVRGFTLVELMAVIAIIGIITAIAVPYYNNYRQTACDQAALADLYNVKAAVQKYLTDETLRGAGVAVDIPAAIQAVLASTDGRYGYPGPSQKCGVTLVQTAGSYGNSAVLAKASEGTAQGRDVGWKLDMAGGGEPIAALAPGSGGNSAGGGDSGGGGSAAGGGTSSGGDAAAGGGQTTSSTASAWARLAEGLGTTVEALKALAGVNESMDQIPWGKLQQVTGKSPNELKRIAGVE